MATDSKHTKGLSLKDARKQNRWAIIPLSKLPDDIPVLAVSQMHSKSFADFHLVKEVLIPLSTFEPEYDQLKEDNKILKDLLKRIEARSATLDNGVNPDSAADKQIASIWEMAHEANTILSPSNTEKNDKE